MCAFFYNISNDKDFFIDVDIITCFKDLIYIIKPFKLGELREVVERAAKEYQLKVEIDRIQRNIKTVEGELRDYRSSQGYAGEGFAASDSQKDGGHLQAQIRELDCLRDAGHLSAVEYEAKRRDLSSHR